MALLYTSGQLTAGRSTRPPTRLQCCAATNRLPPRPKPGPPLIGNLNRVDLNSIATSADVLFKELNTDVMLIGFLGKTAYYLRHADDVDMVLSDEVRFHKGSVYAKGGGEWLGRGLFTQTDRDAHGAMRATLSPAFRADYLKQLDSIFAVAGARLADKLAAVAAANATGPGSAAGGSHGGSGGAGVVELQELCKRMALDSLGLSAFGYNFGSLDRLHHNAGGGRTTAASLETTGDGAASPIASLSSSSSSSPSSSSSSSSSSSPSSVDVYGNLQRAESMFLLLTLELPLPDSWLPGYREYLDAIAELDACIMQVMKQRRAALATAVASAAAAPQQQTPLPPASPTAAAVSAASGLSAGGGGEQQQQQQHYDILAFLLRAQQQQGVEAIPDKQIRDELHTMLFAGSDTSAGTLALLFRMLATHPAVAERAAAEAAAVLVGRPAERLTASDATRRMPYINACLNETLRLFPPGPFLVRIASEGMKIRGYDVPKGQMLVANIYSVHRHRAFYNRPDEFLPERWLPEGAAAGLAPRQANAWLPFSKGTRSCIGRGYAQLQMPIVAAAVLSRVRFELARAPMAVDSIAARAAGSSSDNGAPVADDLELVSSLTLKAKGGVWLRPVLL